MQPLQPSVWKIAVICPQPLLIACVTDCEPCPSLTQFPVGEVISSAAGQEKALQLKALTTENLQRDILLCEREYVPLDLDLSILRAVRSSLDPGSYNASHFVCRLTNSDPDSAVSKPNLKKLASAVTVLSWPIRLTMRFSECISRL